MHLEERIRAGRFPGKNALWLLSLLYQTGVRLRHVAYRFINPQKVPVVVVSVGNIVAGGVGKTPLVHWLASELSKDYKVAILSRGYRSKAEHRKEPTLVEASMEASDVGDEPLWLARKLPAVQVWVCKNRVASAKKAVQSEAEIIILDDGFQHRKLHRDFDIVVVSGDNPYSSGPFLPLGYLRDLPSRLRSATLLAVMGIATEEKKIDLSVPQVFFKRTSPVSLQGKKVALFCAIANPERFLKQVQAAGAEITVSLIKSDHDFFFKEELEMLAQKSGASVLVCTEKDFVKLPRLDLPIMPIPLELSIVQGDEIWKQFINKIKLQVQNVRISSHTS
jgi:tetraacyldisaccharide 4'-kinase